MLVVVERHKSVQLLEDLDFTAVGEPDEILPYRSSPTHDGINIYGDEVSLGALGLNFNEFAQSLNDHIRCRNVAI